MKRHRLTWIVVCLTVILLLVFWQQEHVGNFRSDLESSRPSTNTAAVADNPIPPIGCLPTTAKPSTRVDARETPEAFRKRMESKNATLQFYGKVIDQDSNAVVGAKVKLIVRQWVVSSPSALNYDGKFIPIEKETGPDGQFELHDIQGDALQIDNITKDGYKLEAYAQHNFGAWNSPEPYIFVLWENGAKDPIVRGELTANFFPDGKPYAVDLANHTIHFATNSEGDFQFQLSRPKGVVKWDKFDWTFVFQGQNGKELLPTDEDYFAMLFCPQVGFTASYAQSEQATEEPWRGFGKAQFYMTAKDGQTCGKMCVAWDVVAAVAGTSTNQASIKIQYTVNSSGSRLVR